ncbi:hypothetical protein JW977_03140 [Candidatus Falkowbacteria bacterium]|nr:hypothetical protein [Candidatus Falkowbacteria bacterium]
MPYEKPTLKKFEAKEKYDYIFKQFKGAGFKIKEYPELYERCVELANMPESHFDDAVKMSEIIDILWDEIEKEDNIRFSLEELKLACLFHDIGKSGPVGADRNQRFMIQQIFNPIYFNINSEQFKKAPQFNGKNLKEKKTLMRDLSIKEILDIESFQNKDKIADYLSTLEVHAFDEEKQRIIKQKLDINKHRMIDLWREHDYWTFDLLNAHGNKNISRELIVVSSSHHTLEGHDPAMIDGKLPNEAIALETLDKYLILTLVDKYQAFIDREGVNHEETIKILRNIVDKSKKEKRFGANERIYDQFNKYIDLFDKHPEMAEIITKK